MQPPQHSPTYSQHSYFPSGSGRDLYMQTFMTAVHMPKTGTSNIFNGTRQFVSPRPQKTCYNNSLSPRSSPLAHSRSYRPNGTGRDTFQRLDFNRSPRLIKLENNFLRAWEPGASAAINLTPSMSNVPQTPRNESPFSLRRRRKLQKANSTLLSTPKMPRKELSSTPDKWLSG